jgi:hypothetical protein
METLRGNHWEKSANPAGVWTGGCRVTTVQAATRIAIASRFRPYRRKCNCDPRRDAVTKATPSSGATSMSFLTTVKATGELFDAITDLGVDGKLTGDAQLPLQPMSFYEGNHLKGPVPSPAIVHLEYAVYAVFRGDDLAPYFGTGRPPRRATKAASSSEAASRAISQR